MTCSHCGNVITSCILPEPHPPEVGPPPRLCVSCRRAAVERWERSELAARYRLEMAAPALLEACQAPLNYEARFGEFLPVTLRNKLEAAVALAVLPEAREEGTDARD